MVRYTVLTIAIPLETVPDPGEVEETIRETLLSLAEEMQDPSIPGLDDGLDGQDWRGGAGRKLENAFDWAPRLPPTWTYPSRPDVSAARAFTCRMRTTSRLTGRKLPIPRQPRSRRLRWILSRRRWLRRTSTPIWASCTIASAQGDSAADSCWCSFDEKRTSRLDMGILCMCICTTA